MASAETTSKSLAIQNISNSTISFATINNQAYAYYLRFEGTQNDGIASMRLYGARITYTVTKTD
jgi:hypothetical protein